MNNPGGLNGKGLRHSAFAGEVVIVNRTSPYRWTGPNAQSHWFIDAEKLAHDLDVADERVPYEKIVDAAVVGSNACIVISATLSEIRAFDIDVQVHF
jgi:hypothetical protein